MYQMLIADDDQFVLDGLKEEIDWKKYNIYAVECCTNGKQALEILKQDVYKRQGVQTLRAKNNFKITGRPLHPEFIKNLARIKKAAARCV